MRVDKWKIFDKKGSNLNMFADAFLNFEFITDAQNALGAEAYAVTDPSSIIDDTVILNSGWEYDPNTSAKLTYTFDSYSQVLSAAEASINFIDVSIFNPSPNNSQGIGSMVIDVSTEFTYPSTVFTGALFLDPVSTKLVETEHMAILEETSSGDYIRPLDASNPTLVFRFNDGDPQIRLFTMDEEAQNVVWSDELIFDVSIRTANTPIMINIGFKADDEGVFERKLRVYHRIDGQDYQLAEFLVNAQSIGPDERFDTLIQDFGLPNPKSTPHLFKRADINEAMPDWELLNYKGKHIILEHDQIMPYIGTYKALINAIKWLGYEDIKVKEWFKNVKDSTKLSLYVPYEAEDRTKTILYFSPEERKNLKKLNQLSLVYCITRETGEIDEWGTPLVEECYEYNVNEILIKLRALKEWLEKNIIGVNARITDVTGEGVYFERYKNIIYSTQDKGHRIYPTQSLTPRTMDEASELIRGDASIRLTLLEISNTEIGNIENLKIGDFLQYYWDPSNGSFDQADASLLWWDPSTVAVGAPFRFPLYNSGDIQWVTSVEKTESGAIQDPSMVSSPILIYDNDIRFYDILDSSTIFDPSANLAILIEKGWLRDPSNDIWTDSIAYSFYPDPSDVTKYIVEPSIGTPWKTNGFVNLRPDTNTLLQYAFDDNYKAPLITMRGFSYVDASGIRKDFGLTKEYFLDIVDGKIRMEQYIPEPSTFSTDPSTTYLKKEEYYINFNYDTSLAEQKITLNVVYKSPKAPVYIYDPSIYYHMGGESALVLDNSIYVMNVNHIGPYEVEIFGWDGGNIVYRNFLHEDYEVWTKFPTIWSYIDISCGYNESITVCPSALLTEADVSALIAANLYPIFDRQVPLQGLTLEKDGDGEYYIDVPSISYFVDLPDPGSIGRFYNMTERITNRVGDVFTVDPDYQAFNLDDDVNLVLFDRGQYYFIDEVSGNVSSKAGNDLTITGIPAEFVTDVSTEVYLLNDTRRATYNTVNDLVEQTMDIDISAYQFRTNQLVGMIIDDACTGYAWGSSFRVLDSSADGHHQFEGNIPEFILSDPSRFEITAKHAYSTFADFNIDVDRASEIDNTFNIYLDDVYHQQYHLDSTFVYVNVLFDQEKVLDQWYDPSTDGYLVTGPMYPYTKSITVDPSTLVILDAFYDPSVYMLGQKNIWTVFENESQDILFRVFNENVPYVFNDPGIFDVQVEAYDRYGNLKLQKFDGLIIVRDEE